MSELKVEICRIEKVEHHIGANRLDIVQIKGWQCVVQKGSFKKGDLALYIPIDSLLSEELESKIFGPDSKIKLEKRRIKTVKLRKVISQGLVVLPETVGITSYKEGQDFTESLGIKKYEPPQELPNIYGRINKIKKMYINSNFHKYTDIENIKNHPQVFKDGEQVNITEKLHGSSVRLGWVLNEPNTIWKKIKKFFGYFPAYEFLVGSRNVQLNSSHNKKDYFYDENVYARIAKQYNLKNKLLPGEVLYGEIVGFGIQKNYSYGCKEGEIKFYAYDILKEDKWLDPHDFSNLCYLRGIPKVPLLYDGPYSKEIVEKHTQGPSVLCPNEQTIREGCIIKTSPERTNPYTGRTCLKSINNEYLLLKNNSDFH